MPKSRSTRKLRAIKRAMREARPQPCHRCGQRIDYDAADGEPDAFNAGHRLSWDDYPELREDPANIRPEHERCNKGAGKRDDGPGIGMQSRRWGPAEG